MILVILSSCRMQSMQLHKLVQVVEEQYATLSNKFKIATT